MFLYFVFISTTCIDIDSALIKPDNKLLHELCWYELKKIVKKVGPVQLNVLF